MTDVAGNMPPDSAQCVGCGYALKGLASRACPECGTAFDPDRSETMYLAGYPSRVAHWLLRRARWIWPASSVCVTALLLYSVWMPAYNPFPLLLLLLSWLAVGFAWTMRGKARWLVVRRYRLAPARGAVDDRDVKRACRLFVIGALLAGLNLPFFAAYAVSYWWLQRAARHWYFEVPATQNPPLEPSVHGVFYVTHTYAYARYVSFTLPTGGRIKMKPSAEGDRMELVVFPE